MLPLAGQCDGHAGIPHATPDWTVTDMQVYLMLPLTGQCDGHAGIPHATLTGQ